MQELKKSLELNAPPSPAPYFVEVRIESSPGEVAFSDPCFYCGSLKRRCLHPPPSPRKKLLVIESPSSSSSSSGGGAVLSRPISSSLRTPTSPIVLSPFLWSNSFRSLPDPTAVGDRSPSAEVPFVYRCSDPITPMSPPSFLYAVPPVPSVSKSPDQAVTCPAEKNKRGCGSQEEEWEEESVIDEEETRSRRSEVRVSINCGCGIAREVIFHRDH